MAERGSLLVGTAAVAALLLLSASVASARPSHVHVSLIPLPKSALGPAGRGLKLAYDSGVVSMFPQGEIGGYALHYGNEASGLPGVDSAWTSVDEYSNAKDAKRALSSARSNDSVVTGLSFAGLSVKYRRVKVPAIGSARFGDVTSYSASNIAPVAIFAVWFTDGRYLLEARVAARKAAKAKAIARKLAEKLDRRLERALHGRLHAKEVKPPQRPAPGPPAGGPDLASMGLAATDLSGSATIIANSYLAQPPAAEPDPLAVSEYFEAMQPAGQFDVVTQHIEWFPTANEASFDADRWLAGESAPNAHALDLSGVGDGARCIYLTFNPGIVALVTLSTGQVTEILELDSPSDVPLSDITSVAQAAADKIDAAYSG